MAFNSQYTRLETQDNMIFWQILNVLARQQFQNSLLTSLEQLYYYVAQPY